MRYFKFLSIIIISLVFSCSSDNTKSASIVTKTYDVEVPLTHGLANSLDYVKVHSDVLPLLKNKSNNIVLSWTFKVKNVSTHIFLKGLGFSLVGTEDLTDFKNFKIKHISTDSIKYFGETTAVNADSLLYFEDKIKLLTGENTFQLICEVADNATIKNHLVIKPISMTISGKEYEVNLEPLQRKLGTALLQHGQNGIDTYRIPALTTTNKGTLIAVYDMRHDSSKELQGNIDIGMSRSTDGGHTWQPTDVIIDMGEFGRKPEKLNGVSSPSILYDEKNNTLWVAALWTYGMSEKKSFWTGSREGLSPSKTAQLILVKSTNDGKTWSEPHNITTQVKKPEWQLVMQGPGNGIVVGDSALVFPVMYKEKLNSKSLNGDAYTSFSTLIHSTDNGKSWTIGSGAKSNTRDAQVIALRDGRLMLNMRDERNQNKKTENGRAIAYTDDFGCTWTNHASFNDLLEPNSQASFIKKDFLINGKLTPIVLFSNPSSKNSKNKISIKVSLDEGQTWAETNQTLIDAGEGRGNTSMTKIDDEHLGILYEGSGADLVFQIFHINELVRN